MLESLSARLQKTFIPEKISVPESERRVLEDKLTVCSNNTAKALYQMINAKVDAFPAELRVAMIDEIPRLLNPYDVTTTVLSDKIIGTSNSLIILSAPLKDIVKIADIFLHKERGYFKDITNENVHVIKEFVNILAGYYATALNELLDTSYTTSEPFLSVDPYRVLESDPHKLVRNLGFCAAGEEESSALVFETDFNIPEYDVKMKITLLAGKEDAKNIIRAIGSKR
ncbi:Uncharacterised protein [uncultured archaeon]|nr:Uncharacterised protein [uncultured archaeon]